jgi:hypothetical protein
MEEYKKVMADIKVIHQHLELELAGEVADKALIFEPEKGNNWFI